MENDYISRADFRQTLINTPFHPRCQTTPDLLTSVADRLLDTLELLDDFPVADVRPVVRGEWTTRRTLAHDGEWWCTACGQGITIYMGEDRADRYNFCPNCGADMRPEGKEAGT